MGLIDCSLGDGEGEISESNGRLSISGGPVFLSREVVYHRGQRFPGQRNHLRVQINTWSRQLDCDKKHTVLQLNGV